MDFLHAAPTAVGERSGRKINNDNAIVEITKTFLNTAVPAYTGSVYGECDDESAMLVISTINDRQITACFSDRVKDKLANNFRGEISFKITLHVNTLSATFEFQHRRKAIDLCHQVLLLVTIDKLSDAVLGKETNNALLQGTPLGNEQVFVTTLLGNELTGVTRADDGSFTKDDHVVAHSTRFDTATSNLAVVIGSKMYRLDFLQNLIIDVTSSSKSLPLQLAVHDVSSIPRGVIETAAAHPQPPSDDSSDVDQVVAALIATTANEDDTDNDVDDADDVFSTGPSLQKKREADKTGGERQTNASPGSAKKEGKKRTAPMKPCKACGAMNHARRKICSACDAPCEYKKKSTPKRKKASPSQRKKRVKFSASRNGDGMSKVKFSALTDDDTSSNIIAIFDDIVDTVNNLQHEINTLKVKVTELRQVQNSPGRSHSKGSDDTDDDYDAPLACSIL